MSNTNTVWIKTLNLFKHTNTGMASTLIFIMQYTNENVQQLSCNIECGMHGPTQLTTYLNYNSYWILTTLRFQRTFQKRWKYHFQKKIQLTDGLLEKKNYTVLKKVAEDRSVWRTVRRDCHKPASWADNWKRKKHHFHILLYEKTKIKINWHC